MAATAQGLATPGTLYKVLVNLFQWTYIKTPSTAKYL